MTEQSYASDVAALVIKEIRRRRNWSLGELAERCAQVGAARLTENAIENIEHGRRDKAGRRRREITLEELLALAYVLDIAPVDLLVSKDTTTEPYQVTPTTAAPADTVREWIRGENVLVKPEPGQIGNAAISVSTPVAQILRFVESMPEERGKAVMRRLVLAEQREWQREEIRASQQEQADGDAGR